MEPGIWHSSGVDTLMTGQVPFFRLPVHLARQKRETPADKGAGPVLLTRFDSGFTAESRICGLGGHDADAACDGDLDEPEFIAAISETAAAGRTQPQGALALAGAWRELDDQTMNALVEEIYAAGRLDTGRPVEFED